MVDDDVVDGEAHEVVDAKTDPSTAVAVKQPSAEVVRTEGQAINLFGSDSPVEVIAQATEVAKALADVIEQQQLYTMISGKKHVRVEGWTLLGSMLGVFPVVEWTREIPNGWEARVVAKTRDGAEVGSAESMCLKTESKWKSRDAYAIRSMAQTRATAKALRLPLGFVMTLAGYEATPLEEMAFDYEGSTAQPQEPFKFNPASMYRPDAPSKQSGWQGIADVFNEIDASINWGPIIRQAISGVYGGDGNFRELKEPARSQAAYRAANAAGRLSELFTEDVPFPQVDPDCLRS